jgi:molecular chaperone GrpE
MISRTAITTTFRQIQPKTLRRFFFGKKAAPEGKPPADSEPADAPEVDNRIVFELNPKLFTGERLKHVDLKTFEAFSGVFADSHPKITAKFMKEMNALFAEQSEVNFAKGEIKRLEEINKINEKKIHAAEANIKEQAKEMEEIHDRMLKEKAKEKMFAISKFAKDLLEILDNIERSISTLEKQKGQISAFDDLHARIKTVQNDGQAILLKFGIKKMEDIIGNPVNLNQHDIIAAIPWPGREEEVVIDVTQSGYLIGERVLRAAKVVVVKNS